MRECPIVRDHSPFSGVRSTRRVNPTRYSVLVRFVGRWRGARASAGVAAPGRRPCPSGTTSHTGGSFPAIDKECSFRFVVGRTSGGVGEIQQFEVNWHRFQDLVDFYRELADLAAIEPILTVGHMFE